MTDNVIDAKSRFPQRVELKATTVVEIPEVDDALKPMHATNVAHELEAQIVEIAEGYGERLGPSMLTYLSDLLRRRATRMLMRSHRR